MTLCSADGLSDISMARYNMAWLSYDALYATKYGQVEVSRQNIISADQIFDIALKPESQFANVPVDQQQNLGVGFDDFILNCKFMRHNCSDVGRFILYKHHQFINCYTFRYNMIYKTRNLNILSGPENGLSLMLVGNRVVNNIYDSESTVVNVKGVKVVIHERRSLPPLANGIDIHPGQSTSIALVAMKYSRLNLPYPRPKCSIDAV